jgi:hypothetical protein
MTIWDDDKVVLSCGTEIAANRRIIGIDMAGNVFEGYDGRLGGYRDNPDPDEEDPIYVDREDFTDQERRELAEVMVARWK